MKLATLALLSVLALQAQTSFITGFTPSRLRNDFSGWVGTMFTVSQPVTVTALGRICVAGNSGTHAVEIIAGQSIVIASASISMTGCAPGQFVYATTSTNPLPTNSVLYLVTQETAGGDRWYDYGGSAIQTSTGTVTGSVYQYGVQTAWNPVGVPNTAYGPPNFQYTTAQPSPPTPTPSPVIGVLPGDGLVIDPATGRLGYDPTLIPTHDTVHANENYCESLNGTFGYTCSLPQKKLLSYSRGQHIDFWADTGCSASQNCTLNIDTVGVRRIVGVDGKTPVAISAGPHVLMFDGAVFRLLL